MSTIITVVNGNGDNIVFTPVVDPKYSWRVISYAPDYSSAEVEIWEEPVVEEELP